MPDSPLPPVGALGAAPDVLAALRAAGADVTAVDAGDGAASLAAATLASDRRTLVVGGSVGERVDAARAAVDAGAHVFVAWPPGASVADAEALLARADEAGVEVGVARPLPVAGLLASRPDGWRSWLTTLALEAAADGAMGAIPMPYRLAGALDLCAALAGSSDPSRVDAAAHGDLTAITLRFRTGATATIALRADALADHVRLVASGEGATVEARALAGPLCVDGRVPASETMEPEAVAFLRAVAAARRAPYPLDHALATMRLAERVLARLR